MYKTMKLLLCGALLVAALFSFSAFTSTPSAHAATTGMNPHTTPAGVTGHVVSDTTMSPSYSCPLPVVQFGNSGWAVTLAQQSVNWWYNHNSSFRSWYYYYVNGGMANAIFPIAEDGRFGYNTQEAIEDFQSWDYNATGGADGIVGPKTWHALGHC